MLNWRSHYYQKPAAGRFNVKNYIFRMKEERCFQTKMVDNKIYYENPLIDKIVQIDQYGQPSTEKAVTEKLEEDNYEQLNEKNHNNRKIEFKRSNKQVATDRIFESGIKNTEGKQFGTDQNGVTIEREISIIKQNKCRYNREQKVARSRQKVKKGQELKKDTRSNRKKKIQEKDNKSQEEEEVNIKKGNKKIGKKPRFINQINLVMQNIQGKLMDRKTRSMLRANKQKQREL